MATRYVCDICCGVEPDRELAVTAADCLGRLLTTKKSSDGRSMTASYDWRFGGADVEHVCETCLARVREAIQDVLTALSQGGGGEMKKLGRKVDASR